MKKPLFAAPPASPLWRRFRCAVLATMIAASPGGCSRQSAGPKKDPPPVPVLTAPAVEQDMPVEIRAIGNVLPYAKVTIRSQVTGQLAGAHFKEGQEVRRGDLLFTLDPRPAQAALDQARANLIRDEAQLENARIVFERTKQLFESKFASQEIFDNARAAMAALQGTALADRAAITNATLDLEFTTIRSPMDGVTGAQLAYTGNIIKSPDDPMVVINQIHPVYVAFAVPEQHLAEIRREMLENPLKVAAAFDGLKGPAPQGELTFVDNAVDTTTGTIQLKATFANTDSALWPGQFVQVTMTLAQVPRAVVVPAQAIQTGQNGDYVFVVNSDQAVEMRPVKTGQSVGGATVISSGLKPGETVVTDGQLNLVSGRKVSIQTEQVLRGSTDGPANTR